MKVKTTHRKRIIDTLLITKDYRHNGNNKALYATVKIQALEFPVTNRGFMHSEDGLKRQLNARYFEEIQNKFLSHIARSVQPTSCGPIGTHAAR
jgi:hypothetical protein